MSTKVPLHRLEGPPKHAGGRPKKKRTKLPVRLRSGEGILRTVENAMIAFRDGKVSERFVRLLIVAARCNTRIILETTSDLIDANLYQEDRDYLNDRMPKPRPGELATDEEEQESVSNEEEQDE